MMFQNAKTLLSHLNSCGIKVDFADGKLQIDTPKGLLSPKLKQCLTEHKQPLIFILTHGGFSKEELEAVAEEDWPFYANNKKALVALAQTLANSKLIKQGKLPDSFTAITRCHGCGEVFVPPALVNGGKVLGCMWCFNRIKGLPIPRPNNNSIMGV